MIPYTDINYPFKAYTYFNENLTQLTCSSDIFTKTFMGGISSTKLRHRSSGTSQKHL